MLQLHPRESAPPPGPRAPGAGAGAGAAGESGSGGRQAGGRQAGGRRGRRWPRRLIPPVLGLLVVAAGLFLVWPRPFGGTVSYVEVSGTSMLPTFKGGDLVVLRSHPAYRVGDVVAYRIPRGEFGAGNIVIHRIVGGSAAAGFVTRGDNRRTVDPWRPRPRDVVGRRWLVAPGAGRWFAWFRSPLRLGLVCGALTFLLLVLGPRPAARRRGPAASTPAGQSRA